MAQGVKPEKGEVIYLAKDLKLEMVLIPAGKFLMGSSMEEVDKAYKSETYYKDKTEKELGEIIASVTKNETPMHEVIITKSFYLGKYEVTQEQWEAIMGKKAGKPKASRLPIADISWNECQDFIKKLNAKTKGKYRLPTEAEWEYACRAGTSFAYSFGDNITKKDANYEGGLKPVGSYKPNAFGLYDMHGNVYEFCNDFYSLYTKTQAIDPLGPASGEAHVLRSGSFANLRAASRSSFRTAHTPNTRYYNDGLRLAKSK